MFDEKSIDNGFLEGLNYINDNHIKEIEERFSHYLDWCNSEIANFKPNNKENNEETLNDQ